MCDSRDPRVLPPFEGSIAQAQEFVTGVASEAGLDDDRAVHSLFTVALLAVTHGEGATGADITVRACVHHRGKVRAEAIASVESLPLCAQSLMPLALAPHTDVYGTEQASHQARVWAELP